ncbi:ribosomal RNA small subunit methyltransferase NEP1 isoform X2 [Prunus persica]|uniref:ribosomal RNA small subunit methyltransferase NEP1 isoform X2 n=1 Tax=Prunus persica TaxID=3760 RepID=UPI0002C1E0E2|nr:ribosomal RNA small subunit methyltransferase NEP1 isoform X2 [Prunus persica]
MLTSLRRKKMDPYKYRPDIVHEALRRIMDTRLCKAGRLHAVYIRTDEGVLIKVEPRATIPESLEKFCSQLLQKFSIKSTGGRGSLLRVVKNPVAQHLPANSLKIGLSLSSQKAVDLRDYVHDVSDNANLVFVVGAMAHGRIESENVDDIISVSDYPLSAVVCLERISMALERKWNIL